MKSLQNLEDGDFEMFLLQINQEQTKKAFLLKLIHLGLLKKLLCSFFIYDVFCLTKIAKDSERENEELIERMDSGRNR